ncbi:hypothetical protein NHX12_007749 [Muraenolepis orangiensis]|uniref:PDZ domain-containing protein n=1 Tax=Muraenolepis orangiensis TaxID=630683 RepID=A0A9Q0DU28_9TELE|nr:hypothetical protein NHX12_007749 [Muraenolepis orangiensis]
MASYRQRVVALTKRQGQTFGFFLRVEEGEPGHLVRSLDMGGAAELAGMRDGDRILRVNGTFVDALSHQQVVDLVKEKGVSVSFHLIDATAYNQAKAEGVDLSDPHPRPATNGVSAGGVAERAGVTADDRLLELNGESVENATHDQVVAKIKQAGGKLLFLLVDEDTYRHHGNGRVKVGAGLATVQHLPHKPRIAYLTKGSGGYGYILKEEPKMKGHFIRDINTGSSAERAGLKNMDRLVAVEGQDIAEDNHKQVVDKIRQAGNKCCLLVVDADTDAMYKTAGVSPMLFWEEMKDSASPPSYTEALHLPAPSATLMQKPPAGYGFHLHGIQGLGGQSITQVVRGGAADRAGLQDGDFVVEVNSVNVENSSHEQAVDLISKSGSSLELLVATKSVYDRLKARGVAVTVMLLATSAPVHTTATVEERREDQTRTSTPPVQTRERTPSVSSASSAESVDLRF